MKSSRLGYSLLELSVVLTILSVLIGGGLTMTGASMKREQIAKTWTELERLDEALAIFAGRTGRLPCPANITLPKTHASYGRESCSGTGVMQGGVPFYDLGLPDAYLEDDWKTRYSYAVTADAANSTIDTGETGNITIIDQNSNNIVTDAVWVIVSHGNDRKGGFAAKSGAEVIACSGGKDAENCDDDAIFRDMPPNDGSVAANFSDDLIQWETVPNLFQYMAVDNGVPACDAESGQVVSYSGSTWTCIDQADHLPNCANDAVLMLGATASGEWGCVDRDDLLQQGCSDNQLLKRNGSTWSCVDIVAELPACNDDEILKYNLGTTTWVCSDDVEGGFIICPAGEFMVSTGGGNFACAPGPCTTGKVLWKQGADWVCTDFVNTLPACANGQLLHWTGSTWVCANNCQESSCTNTCSGYTLNTRNCVGPDCTTVSTTPNSTTCGYNPCNPAACTSYCAACLDYYPRSCGGSGCETGTPVIEHPTCVAANCYSCWGGIAMLGPNPCPKVSDDGTRCYYLCADGTTKRSMNNPVCACTYSYQHRCDEIGCPDHCITYDWRPFWEC